MFSGDIRRTLAVEFEDIGEMYRIEYSSITTPEGETWRETIDESCKGKLFYIYDCLTGKQI